MGIWSSIKQFFSGFGSNRFDSSGEDEEAGVIEDMDELQKKLTALALRIAKENYLISLNFSHSSIRQVELILADIHKKYKKTNNEEGLYGIAIEFAAYIITVIEKNTEKGRWERDHPDFGEDSFPFYWRGGALFIYQWCLKRIFDGEGDDVWFKYQAIILEELKNKGKA